MQLFQSIKTAYGAGYRAGLAEPQIITLNGMNQYHRPACPYRGRFDILHIIAWNEGMNTGTHKRYRAAISKFSKFA